MPSKVLPSALAAFAVALVGLAAPVSATSPSAAKPSSHQSYDDPRYADSTTVTVEGTLRLAEIDTFGDRPANDAAFAVTTSDGSSVPVTLTKDLPANGRFVGRLVVRGKLAKALSRKGMLPSSGRTIDGDSAVGRTTLATAEDQGTPVPVADATVTEVAVTATPAPARHMAYVVKMVDQGSVDGTNASIGAAVDDMLSYWTTESSGAITSFDRVGEIRDYDSVANYAPADGCGLNDPFTIWNDARNLFPTVNFNLPGNHLIVLAGDECGGTGPVGVAQVGSSIANGGPSMLTYEPDIFASTGVHELGHNFGLQHANLDDCPDQNICEYFDLYSPMALSISGAAFTPPALGTLYRTELGLTSAGEVTPVALGVDQTNLTQTYALAPRASSSGQRGLLVTDPVTGTTYSVDWRSHAGRDAGTFYGSGFGFGGVYPTYSSGVVIERQSGIDATYLLTRNDASPVVGSFAAGDRFTPSSGLSVSVDTIGAMASVTVTIGAPSAVSGAKPTIRGTATVGRTVTALPGTWTDGATFAYDWRVAGVSTGSRGSTFVVPGTAARKSLTVRVTGSKAGFTSTTVESAPSTVVPGTFAVRTPTISGTAKVGRTLKVSISAWSPVASFKRQWYANGVKISGATATSVRLTSAQRGKRITVKVTGSRTGYTSRTVSSSATKSVAR